MKAIVKGILASVAMIMLAVQAPAQKLKKSVTWENIKAHPAPLPVLGQLVTVESDLSRPSYWSVGSETLDRDYADFELYKNYMSETGVGYARLQSGWAKTEQKKGKYDFSWIDAHVDGLIAEGINPWICLCYGNPIYSDHGLNLNAKLFPDGPVMDAWLKYVKACVTRYKDKVTMWEIWNEPDGGKNGESYPLYANMYIRTAKLIREIDPDAKIAALGVCTPDRPYIRHFLKIVKENNALDLIDYITYHAYWPVPEKVIPAVQKLRADVDAYDPSIGLLQGETGCPAQLEYGHAMNSIEWTEYSQVKWDLRQALNHFGMGIPYSFFTMVDLNYGWMLQSYGLVRLNNQKTPVYKRPKFYAVQHVTSLFTPEMKTCEGIQVTGPVGLQMQQHGLEKNGKKVGCLLWLCGNRPTSSLDRTLVDVVVEGLELKEPVYVDILSGKVHDLKPIVKGVRGGGCMEMKGLPLWDCPVVIMEKTEVNFK